MEMCSAARLIRDLAGRIVRAVAADRGWIFVSAATADRPRVDPLLEALVARGFDVRRYGNLVRPGLAWDGMMSEVRDHADAVLVVWSRAALGSEMVQKEASAAAVWRDTLVGVALDGPATVPKPFAAYRLIDLDGWQGDADDPRLADLVRALEEAAASRSSRTMPAEIRPIPEMSSSVTSVRERLGPSARVTALAIVMEMARIHPEYGDGGLGRWTATGPPAGGVREVDEWLRLAAGSHYANLSRGSYASKQSGEGFVNGRVLVAALADLDDNARAALGAPLIGAIHAELGLPHPEEPDSEAPAGTGDLPFSRLSPSSVRALSYANALRDAEAQSAMHMEHLLLGLYEKDPGPARRVLGGAGIDRSRLLGILHETVDFSSGWPTIDPQPLSSLPPLSTHVRQALF